jgi:hypothetical protein
MYIEVNNSDGVNKTFSTVDQVSEYLDLLKAAKVVFAEICVHINHSPQTTCRCLHKKVKRVSL